MSSKIKPRQQRNNRPEKGEKYNPGPSMVIDSLRRYRGSVHKDKRDKRNYRDSMWQDNDELK